MGTQEKHNQHKANHLEIVFISAGIGALLGLIAYIQDWL